MSTQQIKPIDVPQSGMKEEEAFRRALIDPPFRDFILVEWLKSKKRAQFFLGGSIGLFISALVYSGIAHGRWSPNLILVTLIVVSLWGKGRADTTIAALRAMSAEAPNQSPQPTRQTGG
jgi:hypothetical protein